MLIHLNRNMCSKVSPICKLLNYIITKMDGTFLSPYILAWKIKNKCLFFVGKVFWLKSFNGIFSNQTLKNRKMEFVLNFYIYTCKSIFNLSNHLSCFFFVWKHDFHFTMSLQQVFLIIIYNEMLQEQEKAEKNYIFSFLKSVSERKNPTYW